MEQPEWMGKHYSFYANRECEYYPCHPGAAPENFNCLFCYCPLYCLGKSCGGNFRYLENGFKDCTNCLVPHRRENYGKITARYREIAAAMAKAEEQRMDRSARDMTEDKFARTDREMIESVVGNFLPLTKIPRPSGHEEAVAAWLLDWARDRGFQNAERDAANNVRFDVPATPGLEALPLTVLQGHMDMVCVAEQGRDYDPLRDPIRVVRDNAAGTLTAEGTTLGADDGAGIALALSAAEGKLRHGPLRVICTADEEAGMSGAAGLSAEWLRDAACLINLDSEWPDQVVVSTASGIRMRFSFTPQSVAPAGTAVRVELKGLCGGHSGMEIHKGRCNAIVALSNLLRQLLAEGTGFTLCSLTGGTASNAIPDAAAAVLCVSDVKALEGALGRRVAALSERWKDTEPGLTLTLSEADMPPAALSDADRDRALALASELPNGVHTWSADLEGLVESSSNLGVFRADAGGVEAVALARSSNAARQTELTARQRALAASLGFAVETESSTAPWPYNPDSRLLALCKETYRALHGAEIDVAAIHAGLECGAFAALNPALDMVSIGPKVTDAHSPRETLHLDSIPGIWRLLEGMLTGLK